MKHLVLAVVAYVSIVLVVVLVWNQHLWLYLLVVCPYAFGASFFGSWQFHTWQDKHHKEL